MLLDGLRRERLDDGRWELSANVRPDGEPAARRLWFRVPDTFGAGLAPDELARITTGDIVERQKAIMELVGHWTGRRVEMLRLSPDERAQWEVAMEMMRKKGMEMLAQYRGLGGSYAQMEECPFCDGANKPFGN